MRSETPPINHEAWLEWEDGKVAVYWGHFPRVDGRIEAHTIQDFYVIEDRSPRRLLAAKAECRRGECLEASAARGVVVLLYERVIGKAGNSWFSGVDAYVVQAAGFEPSRVNRVFGLAKLCMDSCPSIPHPIDLSVSGGTLRVTVFGVDAEAEVKIHDVNGNLLYEGACSTCKLPKDAYLVVAKRRVDAIASRYTGYTLTATLTIAPG